MNGRDEAERFMDTPSRIEMHTIECENKREFAMTIR